VNDFNTTYGSYLGIKACLIVYETGGRKRYRLAVRCPLMGSKMLNCRLASSWPSWTQLSFSPQLSLQNIIDPHSTLFDACQRNDTKMITDLVQSRKAGPNDATPQNHTLLFVPISFLLNYVIADHDSLQFALEATRLSTSC
jgi:hypothetical protein